MYGALPAHYPTACHYLPTHLIDQGRAHRRFLSRRGVTSCLHALYSKLGLDQYELETEPWGQTFNLRVLAIRLALRRGLLNRVILDDEAA